MPDSKYLEFSNYGETNILVSAPHGGNLSHPSMHPRKKGKKLLDSYTRRFARKLISALPNPYYAISNIHRKYVDLNRNEEEATEGNPIATVIWNNWYEELSSYITSIRDTYGKGLYIDIHSHNDNKEIEIGYGIPTHKYLHFLNGGSPGATTLDSLGHDIREMIFGEASLGYQLEFFGYDIYKPREDKVYFNGGYNVELFCGQGIGAIQLELPVYLLKRDMAGLVDALSASILVFKNKFVDS